MKKNKIFLVLIILSICGMVFSGYLSYYELFTGDCTQAIISCGKKGFNLLNLPACVYGFIMYFIVFIFSIWGYRTKEVS